MTAACPSSLGADLSRRRTSGPLVFPGGKGPEAMAQQVRAERVPDEAGSPRELRADFAGLPLQRDHLAESPQGEGTRARPGTRLRDLVWQPTARACRPSSTRIARHD